MPATPKITPSKLAENPDVLACAVCRRQPDGSAIVHAIHGDARYGALFQHVLNIHVCLSDETAEVILGNLTLRSYRDRNYILMTLMVRACNFTKSCKRSMIRVLNHLNKVDREYGVTVIPVPAGHLAAPLTLSGGNPPPPEPPEAPVYQNGWTPRNEDFNYCPPSS